MTSESYPFLNHCEDLESRYSEGGNITWDRSDFNVEKLESSRDLFTLESLENRSPITKRLEVYALLSGLPFENDFDRKIFNLPENCFILGCGTFFCLGMCFSYGQRAFFYNDQLFFFVCTFIFRVFHISK